MIHESNAASEPLPELDLLVSADNVSVIVPDVLDDIDPSTQEILIKTGCFQKVVGYMAECKAADMACSVLTAIMCVGVGEKVMTVASTIGCNVMQLDMQDIETLSNLVGAVINVGAMVA